MTTDKEGDPNEEKWTQDEILVKECLENILTQPERYIIKAYTRRAVDHRVKNV
jgi:hypothetical protein